MSATSRFFQPRYKRDVIAGRLAGFPAPGVEKDRVARRDRQARPFFPGLDVFLVHMRPRFEMGNASQPWNVDQHAPRDHASVQRIDAELLAACFRDRFFEWVAVVDLAAVISMTERVDVREARPVKCELLLLGRECCRK